MAGLILSWDNPTDLFVPAVRKATVDRRIGDIVTPLLMTDVGWGMAEDQFNDDVEAEYTVTYKGPYGEHLFTVGDSQITRYAKPDNICRIDIALSRIDGSPDAGRQIEFSDEYHEIGEYVKRVVTNTKGEAVYFASHGSELLVRVNGKANGYLVAIPALRNIDLKTLTLAYGSPVDTDPRRSLGLVW